MSPLSPTSSGTSAASFIPRPTTATSSPARRANSPVMVRCHGAAEQGKAISWRSRSHSAPSPAREMMAIALFSCSVTHAVRPSSLTAMNSGSASTAPPNSWPSV